MQQVKNTGREPRMAAKKPGKGQRKGNQAKRALKGSIAPAKPSKGAAKLGKAPARGPKRGAPPRLPFHPRPPGPRLPPAAVSSEDDLLARMPKPIPLTVVTIPPLLEELRQEPGDGQAQAQA